MGRVQQHLADRFTGPVPPGSRTCTSSTPRAIRGQMRHRGRLASALAAFQRDQPARHCPASCADIRPLHGCAPAMCARTRARRCRARRNTACRPAPDPAALIEARPAARSASAAGRRGYRCCAACLHPDDGAAADRRNPGPAIDHGGIGLQPHAQLEPAHEHARHFSAFLGRPVFNNGGQYQRLVRRRQGGRPRGGPGILQRLAQCIAHVAAIARRSCRG